MRGRREERIEAVIDHGAAAVLAAAVGFSLLLLLNTTLAEPQPGIVSATSAVVAFWITARILRGVTVRTPIFEIRPFDLPLLEAVEELILTEADRLGPAEELILTHADRFHVGELVLTDADRLRKTIDELVLDDILAELGPNSRVVRLFDPAAMPTPAQLNARIEKHLRGEPSPAAPADASQALFEALSELRRSLR